MAALINGCIFLFLLRTPRLSSLLLYMLNVTIMRADLFGMIYILSPSVLGLWLLGGGGDFNVVFNAFECLGTFPPLLPSIEFVEMICNCGLCETSFLFIGSTYTWCGPSSPHILKRLDRILVNPPWNAHFHTTFVEHLHWTLFDYLPLLLSAFFLIPPDVMVFVSKIFGSIIILFWTLSRILGTLLLMVMVCILCF